MNKTSKGREVWYMCHPVSGDVQSNLKSAKKWLRWFLDNDRSRVYVAPWIAEVECSLGGIPIPWDQALADDEEVVRRCDGVVLTGGRVSPGMLRELDAAIASGGGCIDLSIHETPDSLEEHASQLGQAMDDRLHDLEMRGALDVDRAAVVPAAQLT